METSELSLNLVERAPVPRNPLGIVRARKVCILTTFLLGMSLFAIPGEAQEIGQAKVTVNRPVQSHVVKPNQPTRTSNPIAATRPKVQAPRVLITRQQLGLAGPIVNNNPNRYLANNPNPALNPYMATIPYPLLNTPANQAKARDDAWAAYRASLQAPTDKRVAEAQNAISLTNGARGDQLAGGDRYHFQYTSNDVRSLQQSLRRLGFYDGLPDGYFGEQTQQAIENYQVAHNMAVTGIPDRALYSQLGVVR
jgi:putative peptidoglycan binding protein